MSSATDVVVSGTSHHKFFSEGVKAVGVIMGRISRACMNALNRRETYDLIPLVAGGVAYVLSEDSRIFCSTAIISSVIPYVIRLVSSVDDK